LKTLTINPLMNRAPGVMIHFSNQPTNNQVTTMRTMKKYASGALAILALSLSNMSGIAQTTNYVVYNFNTDQVAGTWGNFYGGALQSALWDSTVDASNNPSSGSMKVVVDYNHNELTLWDGPNAYYTADITTTFTNLSFDIRFDISSAVRTNTSAAGQDGSAGVGSLDYGDYRIGGTKNYDQDWFYTFAIPATNGLGQPNTNWNHVSIALNTNTVPFGELTTFTAFLIDLDDNNYGNNNTLLGTQTFWVDNVQFIGPAGGIPLPPPAMGLKKTTPALRLFGGSGGIYSRSQLTTVDQNQSWIGGAYPVTYSFTLLSVPTSPGNLDMHIFFLPLAFFNGTSINNTHDMDFYVLNELWLRVVGGSGSDTCVADLSWKTNAGFANPNHTDLRITNSMAVGTWTLTFNSASSGTLTAPGAIPVPFTISDPNVVTDFGNSMILSFGNQCNGITANEGVPNDWAKISVSGVSGFNETNDFTQDATIDPTIWDTSNSNTRYSVVPVSTNTPFWVTWSSPSTGYGLGVSTNLVSGPWMLPEFYNNYGDGNNVPNQALQGSLNWALIPASCLPTVDGQPQSGQPLAPDAFFRLSDPVLTQ
jgi:hypothetical protein